MTDQITERGIVLSVSLLGEYDKRLVILTEHMGKITVFANGARKQNSRFTAASQSFTLGRFTLRPGRNTYTLVGAEIERSFMDLTLDPEAYAAAAYASELAEYYTQENLPAKDELNLLYVTYCRLLEGKLSQDLIRAGFIFKLFHIEGEAPESEEDIRKLGKKGANSETAVYSVRYIYAQNIGATYSFQINSEAVKELIGMAETLVRRSLDRPLRSEETIREMREFHELTGKNS